MAKKATSKVFNKSHTSLFEELKEKATDIVLFLEEHQNFVHYDSDTTIAPLQRVFNLDDSTNVILGYTRNIWGNNPAFWGEDA